MLKIIPNIFEAVHGKLELSDDNRIPAVINSSHFGIVIPDLNAVSFSEESSSTAAFSSWLKKSFDHAKWLLFVMDSAWQDDTQRMRHLGLKPTLGALGKAGVQIHTIKTLSSNEGKIRHAGLIDFEQKYMLDVIRHIAHNQRYAFLVGDLMTNSNFAQILDIICDEGISNDLNSKQRPFFSWEKLALASNDCHLIFCTAVGWPEPHCDLRYILFGAENDLNQILRSSEHTET